MRKILKLVAKNKKERAKKRFIDMIREYNERKETNSVRHFVSYDGCLGIEN